MDRLKFLPNGALVIDFIGDIAKLQNDMKHRLNPTASIPKPTYYVSALTDEFADFAFDEAKVPTFKGNWREVVFSVNEEVPVDLEIGTGNGYHFAYQTAREPHRRLIGLEVKFKPLIQTIRRALLQGSTNMRVARYNAALIKDLFEVQEINNVYIHHPDPWPKLKQTKHRLMQIEFLDVLYSLQRPQSFVEFQTDDQQYFEWALPHCQNSKYRVQDLTYDLHASPFAREGFETHFEKLFRSKGLPIYYLKMYKD